MAYLGDGKFEAIGHHELMMVTADGTHDVWGFGYQPTTNDIADYAKKRSYTMAVQKIGNVFEVYDLKTLRQQMGTWTIGIPVATHEDVDAAIMAAMLLS